MIAIPDYCDTPDEVAKNPEAKKYIALCANGNLAAYNLGWSFWCFSHCIDDLIDGDKAPSMEVVAKCFVQFIDTLTNNEFYQTHKQSLYPIVVHAFNRWLDGETLARSDDAKDHIRSEVLRCGDLEFYLHIAYLSGGWDYMRSLKEIRTFDKQEN